MAIGALPQFIRDSYQHMEYNHATAILQCDFPNEWKDLIEILTDFRLYRSAVLEPGKNKSPIANALDRQLYDRGWKEKQFQTSTIVDGVVRETPTHKVDCFKNKIAIEIEWNNKDPFYDRDLNNFRLLFDLKAISVGVVITRATELQKIFNELGKGSSYGNSTTHYDKLEPRILGGGAGGCPVLVFGITRNLYVED